jgi:hypothetical protein
MKTAPVQVAGVTRRGNLVWEDEDGNREWSPRTQRRVQIGSIVAVVLLAALVLAMVTGLVPAAPWSAIGRAS